MKDKVQKNSSLQQLTEMHKHWEQMRVKCSLRMRKKIKKDKRQYYDFDFSKNQYFYTYPKEHISFANPHLQNQFFDLLIQDSAKDFSQNYRDIQKTFHPYSIGKQLTEIIKPFQLYDFIFDFRKEISETISKLRIMKTLIIMDDYQGNKHIIDLIQSEIRSYICKGIRLSQNIEMGQSYNKRINQAKCHLKIRKIDQMYSSNVIKTDFAVYNRMILTKQRLSFNMDILKKQLKLKLKFQRFKIEKIENNIKKNRYLNKKKDIAKMIQRFKVIIIEKVSKKDPIHFQKVSNRAFLEQFLKEFDFIYQIQQKNKQQTPDNLNYHYTQVPYIPSNYQQAKMVINRACSYYFPTSKIEELWSSSLQRMFYQINSLTAINFRVLTNSYSLVNPIKQQQLLNAREIMRKQLQSVMSNDIYRLLNVQTLETIVMVDEGQCLVKGWQPKNLSTKFMISKRLITNYKYKDPEIKSLLSLLTVKVESTIRQHIHLYTQNIIQKFGKKKWEYLRLYYLNMHKSQKMHIIKVINSKIQQTNANIDDRALMYLEAMVQDQLIDSSLLQVSYCMLFQHCLDMKTKILEILNASTCIIYKVRDKMNVLRFKSQLPFEMSKQFLRRFTYTSIEELDHMDFVEGEQLRQGDYPSCNSDKIVISKQKVEVRRVNSKNPLMQGVKIIYAQSLGCIERLLQKVESICSLMIEKRQNYLNQNSFTHIVDRIQLIADILQKQHLFQRAKFNLINQHFEILSVTVDPDGIIEAIQRIVDVYHTNYIYQVNELSFYQSYDNHTEILQNQLKILKILFNQQTNIENRQQKQCRQKYFHSNMSHTTPQLSSMYYQQDFSSEGVKNAKDSDDEDEKDGQKHNRQEQVKTDNRLQVRFQKSSQYHPKVSFQQILNSNSISRYKSQNALKSQLLSRKKKKLISDSVLGAIFRSNNQYQLFITKIYSIIQTIQQLYIDQTTEYNLALTQIALSFISTFQSQDISIRQVFSEELIQTSLNSCHKILQKITFQPSNLEHYLCFNPELIQQLYNSKSPNCNVVRGLYTCLNYSNVIANHYISLINEHYLRYIIQLIGQTLVSYSKLKSFSPPFSSYCYLIEQKDKKKQKSDLIVSKIIRNKEYQLLAIDEYQLYYRSVVMYDYTVTGYFQQIFVILSDEVNNYENIIEEMEAMDFGCYKNGQLLNYEKINNKVYLHKRIQTAKSLKSNIINIDNFNRIIQLFEDNLRLQYPKFKEKDKIKDILKNSINHRSYIKSVMQNGYYLDMYAKQIYSNHLNRLQTLKISSYLSILPQCNKTVKKYQPSRDLANIIFQQRHNIRDNTDIDATIIIQHRILNISALKKVGIEKIQTFKIWLEQHILNKKLKQFENVGPHLQPKYFFMWLDPTIQRFVVPNCPYPSLKQTSIYINNVKIRQWIQIQLLIFGCSLESEQLRKFQILMIYKEYFPVFYQDNTQNLISPFQLRKMQAMEMSSDIMIKYNDQYLSFAKLKKKYRAFVDDLDDAFKHLEEDQFLILYCGIPEYFDKKSPKHQFLRQYGKQIQPKNSLQTSLKQIYDQNAIRKTNYNFNLSSLIENLWSGDRQKLRQMLNIQDKNICDKTVISVQGKGFKIRTQPLKILYKLKRLQKIMNILQLETNIQSWGEEFKVFSKKIIQKLEIHEYSLSNTQSILWNFSSNKTQSNTLQLVLIKEYFVKTIIFIKFYQSKIKSALLKKSTDILKRQLELYRALQQNLQEHQTIIKQKLILKHSLNNVLAPKTRLNAFLSSPLQISNYFFSGSYKLGYLDLFLNKLKNRAALVDLAEGGFGFLLKIPELDQTIDHLCRSIIGFSEKEFLDRFRTFLEAYQQLKRKYIKTQEQLKFSKNIIKILKQNQSKQIQSILYEKLNNYLQLIMTKDKSYHAIVQILKGLDNHYASQYNAKFKSQISILKQQNKNLRQQYMNFKQIMNQVSHKTIKQSKESLLSQLKNKAQTVLNKSIVGFRSKFQNSFVEVEKQDSEILLKKLQKQKHFYELKISGMKNKYQRRVQQLEQIIKSQKQLQNNLILEEEKVKLLQLQLNKLQQNCISVDKIKADMISKEQEQTLQRFRLIKINQSLNGKLQRFEKKMSETDIQQNVVKTVTNSCAVQTAEKPIKRHSIRIKTQSNPYQFTLTNEVALWREKWQNSQKRYHDVMTALKKVHQNFTFSRNYRGLAENILKMGEQFQLCRFKPLLKN